MLYLTAGWIADLRDIRLTSSGSESDYSRRSSSNQTGSRPDSAAWQELRGSRPNSALVAQQIEGYDSDFMVSGKSSADARTCITAATHLPT